MSLHNSVPVAYMGKVRVKMKNNNYTSFFQNEAKEGREIHSLQKMRWEHGMG